MREDDIRMITFMIQAVIFDMDGVIVDSERHWPPFEKEFLRSILPSWDENEYKNYTGKSVYDTFDNLAKAGLAMSRDEFIGRYDWMAESVYGEKSVTLPHFQELLTFCMQQNLAIAIASSSPKRWIEIVIEKFDLHEAFKTVISAQYFQGEGKPSPRVYLEAAKALGIDPQYCLAIEDSRNGVVSAKGAGMYCVGLRNGFNDLQDLSGSDIIVSDLGQILSIINQGRI